MTTFIPYDILKADYEQFKKTLESKKPFERYVEDLKFIRTLIQGAKIEGLDKDVFEYREIEKQDIEKLRDLGYNVK